MKSSNGLCRLGSRRQPLYFSAVIERTLSGSITTKKRRAHEDFERRDPRPDQGDTRAPARRSIPHFLLGPCRIRSSAGYKPHRVLLLLTVHLILGWRRLRDLDCYRDDPLVLRKVGSSRSPSVSSVSRSQGPALSQRTRIAGGAVRRTSQSTIKRAALWVLEQIGTSRRRVIQRAGRLTRPGGTSTLTCSANNSPLKKSIRPPSGRFARALRR